MTQLELEEINEKLKTHIENKGHGGFVIWVDFEDYTAVITGNVYYKDYGDDQFIELFESYRQYEDSVQHFSVNELNIIENYLNLR